MLTKLPPSGAEACPPISALPCIWVSSHDCFSAALLHQCSNNKYGQSRQSQTYRGRKRSSTAGNVRLRGCSVAAACSISWSCNSLIVEDFRAILQYIADKYKILRDSTSVGEKLCLCGSAGLHYIPEVTRRYRRLECDRCTDGEKGRRVARCGVHRSVGC